MAEHFICKIASLQEMNTKWDCLIAQSVKGKENWIVWKKKSIENYKQSYTIPYYGILEGNIICEATAMINPEVVQNSTGLVDSHTVYLSAFRTISEYQGKGYFSKLFQFIVRYLLEKAYNTEHAINLLNELPIASNCNILLADKSGNMVVVECTPLLKQVRTPIETQYGKIICTVNNFTSENMKQYDYSDGNVYNSVERYNVVVNSLPKLLQGDVIGNTQKLLKGEYGFMGQYEKELCFETVWSSIFDLASLSIYRAEGSPMRKKFISDNRLCKYRK